MVDRVPATLLAALADLVKWLDDTKVPSMIIGGVAASVLGRPRLTQDVDALAILPEADWANAVSSDARHGILPRVENALDFAHRSRVLLMRHAESGIDMTLHLAVYRSNRPRSTTARFTISAACACACRVWRICSS